MASNPVERGVQAVKCAIEETRRLGITKEATLNHFLYHEEAGGTRGAFNAAENACRSGMIAEEEKVAYVMGWLLGIVFAFPRCRCCQ